jgi:hypothetical protein
MNHLLWHLNLSSKEKQQTNENYFLNIFASFYRSDVKLYKDDAEIKYSKTLDSCKIPQVKNILNKNLFLRIKKNSFFIDSTCNC